MSLLFSRYPRLGAIVIDWRCGTSPDPSLYFPLFLSLALPLPSLLLLLSSTLACYRDSLLIVWQTPRTPGMKACAPIHHHVDTHTHTHTIDEQTGYYARGIVRFAVLATGLEARHLVPATVSLRGTACPTTYHGMSCPTRQLCSVKGILFQLQSTIH